MVLRRKTHKISIVPPLMKCRGEGMGIKKRREIDRNKNRDPYDTERDRDKIKGFAVALV